MTDPELDGFANSLRASLLAAGIVVLDGFASERTSRVIVMPSQSAAETDVVAAITRLSPAFVMYHLERLDHADVEAISADPAEDAATEDPPYSLDRIEFLRTHIGEVTSLSVSVVGDARGSPVTFAWTASWAAAIDREAEDRDSARRPAPAPSVSDVEVQALAREIALSPKYQSVTMSAKAHAARMVAGDRASSLSDHDWWRVVSEARSIWEAEIRPERDAELTKRAVALLEEGKTKAAIARNLGITPKQLTALIG